MLIVMRHSASPEEVSAVVEAIERDFDDQVHLAVVLEDDPGRDLGMLRQPGHRFFYSPEEVEPLAMNHEVSHEG